METTRVELILELVRNGNAGARDQLLRLADETAQRTTRRFLSAFPTVAAWYETGDVRQLALLRLDRTFSAVEIQDAAHFHRLIAVKVRHTLLDLKRQLRGPRGLAFNQMREADVSGGAACVWEPADESLEPGRLSEWLEIHQAIEALPEPHREMFDLLWYSSLTQAEAAGTLGISERHVRRRWSEARLALFEAIPEAFGK